MEVPPPPELNTSCVTDLSRLLNERAIPGLRTFQYVHLDGSRRGQDGQTTEDE